MSTDIRILWIDDDCENHKEDAKNLEHAMPSLSIEIIHPTKLEEKLKLEQKNMPDLYLVDYYLNEKPSSAGGEKYPDRGITVAGKLKENYPNFPVYGVSHRDDKGIFGNESQAANSVFDKILTFKILQDNGANILFWDAKDYEKIRNIRKENIDDLFLILKVPDSIKCRIQLVLPDTLRKGLGTKKEGNSIAFGRWVFEKFLQTPGFLYDDLHAATHLGMNEAAFKRISQDKKYEKKFKKIKYTGIFSKTSQDLWWVSELNNLVFSSSRAKKIDHNMTWEIAPILFNISDDEYSKCIVCNEPYPELVGINREDEKNIAPIHYRCSETYPFKKQELFFDEIRGFNLTP